MLHVVTTVGQCCCILVTWSLFLKGRNVNPEGLVRTRWAVNPSVALQGVSASVRKVGTGLRTHSAALIIPQAPCASPLRDTWQGFLVFWYYYPRGSLTDENVGVPLMWRRFPLKRSSVPERRGDMGQLYGATLLPFGALCVVFLWESGASSIRTTLAVDTSRWVPWTWLGDPKNILIFCEWTAVCWWRHVNLIHNKIN